MSATSTLTLSGCLNLAGDNGDDDEGGGDTATPDGSMASSTQSRSLTPEVPTVTNPLDVSEIKANPCTALSSEQVQQLGVKPGKRDSGEYGPICEYEYAGSVNNEFNIMLTNTFDNGLADIYARKPSLDYFEPTQVAGFPAVYTGVVDRRNDGDCTLYIGLTDTFALGIFAQLNGGTDYSQPCEVVERVANAIIKHLKDET